MLLALDRGIACFFKVGGNVLDISSGFVYMTLAIEFVGGSQLESRNLHAESRDDLPAAPYQGAL